MTEEQQLLWGGVALIVAGVGTILFGGTHERGHFIEILGIRIGKGESEPMSRGASWFWGIAFVIGGVVLVRHSGAFG